MTDYPALIRRMRQGIEKILPKMPKNETYEFGEKPFRPNRRDRRAATATQAPRWVKEAAKKQKTGKPHWLAVQEEELGSYYMTKNALKAERRKLRGK